MKSIRTLCVSFFAMLCMGLTSCTKTPLPPTQQLPVVEIVAKNTPAVAEVKPEVPKVALTEQFALAKGDSLWKHALSQNVARKDWPKYWVDACKLSQVPCTDSAWRKLRVGHVVTVPRSDVAIAEDVAKAEILALTAQTMQLLARAEALEKQVVESKHVIAEKNDSLTRWIAGFAIVVIFLGMWLTMKHNALRDAQDENERLKAELKDSHKDVTKHFIEPTTPVVGNTQPTELWREVPDYTKPDIAQRPVLLKVVSVIPELEIVHVESLVDAKRFVINKDTAGFFGNLLKIGDRVLVLVSGHRVERILQVDKSEPEKDDPLLLIRPCDTLSAGDDEFPQAVPPNVAYSPFPTSAEMEKKTKMRDVVVTSDLPEGQLEVKTLGDNAETYFVSREVRGSYSVELKVGTQMCVDVHHDGMVTKINEVKSS